MPLIELGLIDGNYWNAAHVDAVENAINTACKAGDIRMSIAAAETPGWLILNGQVVANAQALYPDLWTVAPAGWKVGASLTLPNATTRFPIGGAAVGVVGGANSRNLSAANLPPHAHSMAHDHGAINSGGQSNHHVHSVHPHAWPPGQSFEYFVVQNLVNGPRPQAINTAAGTGALVGSMESIKSDMDEYDDGHALSDHTHPVDLPPFGGNTDNGPGTGAAVDTTPAFITFQFFIKAH
jgi:microcystin-dependent protein